MVSSAALTLRMPRMSILCRRGNGFARYGRFCCRVDRQSAVECRFFVNVARSRRKGYPTGGLQSLRSFRPLPLSPASPLSRELVSNGPLPLPLCGGAQAPGRVSLPPTQTQHKKYSYSFDNQRNSYCFCRSFLLSLNCSKKINKDDIRYDKGSL